MPVKTATVAATPVVKRGPGRPPGSKNATPPGPARPAPVPSPVPSPSAASVAAKLIAGRPLTTADAQALVRRPGAPARPGMSAPPIVGNGMSARPAAPPAPPVDVSALTAQITAQTAEIQRLNEAISALKAKPTNVRTPEEIVTDGANGLRPDDWRHAYQGVAIEIYQFERAKNGAITIHDGALTEDGSAYQHGHVEAVSPMGVMLAIPRSNDVGGRGTAARNARQIAIHWQLREDGNYEGEPEYATEAELASLWASS